MSRLRRRSLHDRDFFVIVAYLAVILAIPQRAFAWGREGHQITVITAEHHMRPETDARGRSGFTHCMTPGQAHTSRPRAYLISSCNKFCARSLFTIAQPDGRAVAPDFPFLSSPRMALVPASMSNPW